MVQRHGDQASRVLAGLQAHGGILDAMRHAVAQQVLEGRRHPVEHASIHLDRAPCDVQPHLAAGVLGGLAHYPVQPLGKTLEFDHARAQQTTLQLARLARLRREIVFGRLHRAVQGALHRGHVVDRLGHHSRQLLHTGETVELQRIEALLGVPGLR